MKKILLLVHRLYRGFLSKILFSTYNRINLYVQSVEYEQFPDLRGPIYLNNQGRIVLGNNIRINSGTTYNPIGGNTRCFWTTKPGGVIKIGENTGISNTVLYSFNRIEIGRDVLIGNGCKIYDSDFHPIGRSGEMVSRQITIGDGVFIGAHSIILKGVTIGNQAVVGAGSVVTRDIPAGEIWAGNPAKFIKKVE